MTTFGIIGYPLGHSFSRQYFTEKFAREQWDARYLNFEIREVTALQDILRRYPDLKGFNVTIPHKQHIIALLDEISEEAQKIGAVNCVKVTQRNGRPYLSGYNTDVYGFKNSLLRFIPAGITQALILGNGGAAKAVRYVLRELDISPLTVSRTPRQTDEVSYTEAGGLLEDYPLIINTTPLGTWPAVDTCPPLPYDRLSNRHYLFDLVYNPATTEFMKRGAAAGAHVRNGLEMLTGQAERGWEIWGEAKR